MSNAFVATDTVLDKILARKVEELAERRAIVSEVEMMRRAENAGFYARDMLAALRGDCVSLIAEVKCASPSKGLLANDFAPVMIAATYAYNGASAISMLTDEWTFSAAAWIICGRRGRRSMYRFCARTFTIDAYQVYEGRAAGADAILLIVAALSDGQLYELYALTAELGMNALVEVHNEWEMERALRLGAKLIGINNRDLRTFDVDLATTARLAGMVDDDVLLVAESGIFTPSHVREMGQQGAQAVLVGESLVKAADMVSLVRILSGQPRGQHD